MEERVALAPSCYIRLRGLPFSAKEDDVRAFLEGVTVRSVTFTLTSTGRASGECYVELENPEGVEEAKKMDKKEMNGRYIEIFSVTEGEVSWMIRHNVIKLGNVDQQEGFVVRLRGIPFTSTSDDICDFFKGLDVDEVVIDKEPGGRPSGEAYVRLANKEHAEMALERNRQNMGSRYVEVFRSSMDELEHSKTNVSSPSAGRNRGGRYFPAPKGEPVPLRFANVRYPNTSVRNRYVPSDLMEPVPMRGPYSHGRNRSTPYDIPYDRYSRLNCPSYAAPCIDDVDFEDQLKVYMRGLPYNANSLDIEDFFKPLNCVDIRLGYNEDRRPSGDACVIFSTLSETREALSRNKCCIGNRYIELFSGNNAPMTQKYITYKRVGGAGSSYSSLASLPQTMPTSMNRLGYISFEDTNDLRKSVPPLPYMGPSNHYFPEEQERPYSFRQWSNSGPPKSAW